MNVAEMREKLSGFPDDTPVCVYEEGWGSFEVLEDHINLKAEREYHAADDAIRMGNFVKIGLDHDPRDPL